MAIRAEIIQYDHVPVDGVVGEGVFVPADGSTIISPPDGGCGTPRCGCFRGHCIQRLFPCDAAGTVFGYFVEFDSREELESVSAGQIARAAQNEMH
ncbi:hypothetical protein FSO04_42750 [Paraburkholderia madseniana]|uniref:Uncharacterized protein n=1 Tax=Paraburkholderia madseniana TaxID=2599607 RepID=A0A6N6W0S8_9BURK|nr:hypothetical protein [Paraburkholderia madseniana]KAE8753871.1 hypothetical protein FSO04_42750 [Paraburkholderia madseniana]